MKAFLMFGACCLVILCCHSWARAEASLLFRGEALAQAAEASPSQSLAQGWEAYNAGRLAGAEQHFRAAISGGSDSVRNEALLGLGYTLMKRSRPREAATAFKELVRNGYRLEETAPGLVGILTDAGDYDAARDYLDKVPAGRRGEYRSRIVRGELQEALNRSASAAALKAAVDRSAFALRRCEHTDVFLLAASRLDRTGAGQEAADLYEDILACHPQGDDLRLRILGARARLLELSEALGELDREAARTNVPATYRREVNQLAVNLLKERLGAEEPESDAYKAAASEILRRSPDDADARISLAWHCYNTDDYNCALTHFSWLRKAYPSNEEYLAGKALTLARMDRTAEAIVELRTHAGTGSEGSGLLFQLYMQMANRAFEDASYEESEAFSRKALEVDPASEDALTILGWSLYHQNRLAEAVDVFEQSYRVSGSSRAAANLIVASDRQGDIFRTLEYIEELEESDKPTDREIAAGWYLKQGSPVKAGSVYDGPGTCFENCDSAWIEGLAYYRNKSGDDGFSKLEEWAFPARLHLPLGDGWEIFGGAAARHLDAGTAPDDPFAGTYYRRAVNSSIVQREMEDSLWVWHPELGIRKEDWLQYELVLGTTPLEGPVDPMVTFKAGVTRENHWSIDVHQCPVRETLLSYVGQQDPYSEDVWGRVLKTGVHGWIAFDLGDPWWVSFDAGYDYLWGEDVVVNWSVSASASLGLTRNYESGDLSYGLVLHGEHFKRNTDFFTYGHGGYFSPELFLMAGPFVRFVTPSCRDYWFDGWISAGYSYFKTEDAPFYYEVDESIPAGLNGTYEGESESGLGISGRVQGLKLLTDYLALGGAAALDNSQDYTQWQAALALHIYFEPRKTLCWPRPIFPAINRCDR